MSDVTFMALKVIGDQLMKYDIKEDTLNSTVRLMLCLSRYKQTSFTMQFYLCSKKERRNCGREGERGQGIGMRRDEGRNRKGEDKEGRENWKE